jgi:putative MATE family efflux protein
MNQPTRRLAQDPIGRLLISFSLPAIAGMVVGSLYTVIDRAFLGNVVGPDAIAGLSICMPIAFVIMAFGMLVGIGSGALVSIRLGEQKRDQAELILGNALTVTVVMAAVLTVVFRAALDPLLVLFGASPHVLPYARQFMHVILLGSVLQYVSFGLNAIIRAEGNPRLAMMTMFLNAGMNIALDAVFILVLRMGVTGAAVATVLSQGASAIWTLAHFRSSRSVLRLRLVNLRPRAAVLRPMLAIGLAPFTMHIAGSVVYVLLNRGLARYGGDDAISAYGIIGSVAMLMLMPVFGLNQGAQPIIGFNHGAGRQDRVRRTLLLASLAATAVVTAGFAASQLFPQAIIRAFSQDPAIVQMGSRGMRIVLLLAPVVGFQIIAASYFQAIGRASIALVLTLLRQVIVLIPLVLILPTILGLDGIWIAAAAADGVSSLLTAIALVWQLRRPIRAVA